MKTLYFLRHADAGSQTTAYADFDRPLVERGRTEAEAVATYLQTKGITFDFVLCSSALRAQETLEPLRANKCVEDVELSETFYNISEDKILSHLNKLPLQAQKVLYIGHNPGIAFAILRFSKSFLDFLKEGLEPATLVGFEISVEKWENLEWGEGTLIDHFHPPLASKESPAPKES